MATITSKNKVIADRLTGLATRAKSLRAFLNTEIIDIYKKAQAERWITENVSEGTKWEAISALYKKQKLTRFKKFPGQGTKTMIATNVLVNATTGKTSGGFLKTVTDRTLTIKINATKVPYAKYASDVRPTMEFGRKTVKKMRTAIKDYIKGSRR